MVLFGSRALTVAALAGTIAFGTAGFGVSAQESTPMAGMAGLPNHIHEGTCDNLDPAPLVPLADLVFRNQMDSAAAATPGSTTADAMATPIGDTAMEGLLGEAIPVAVATTEVDLALEDILAAPHAINVHESAENIAVYVACGDIVGTPDEQGNLFIGLGELNDSGLSGIAWLLGDGDQTTVTVFLARDEATMDGPNAEDEGVQGFDEEGNAEGTPIS